MAGKAQIEQIKTLMGDRYKPCDDEIIKQYCDSKNELAKLRAQVRKMGIMTVYINKFGAKNLVKNPLLVEITKKEQVLIAQLKALGLTAAQRKRVVEDDDGDSKDDFESF